MLTPIASTTPFHGAAERAAVKAAAPGSPALRSAHTSRSSHSRSPEGNKGLRAEKWSGVVPSQVPQLPGRSECDPLLEEHIHPRSQGNPQTIVQGQLMTPGRAGDTTTEKEPSLQNRKRPAQTSAQN